DLALKQRNQLFKCIKLVTAKSSKQPRLGGILQRSRVQLKPGEGGLLQCGHIPGRHYWRSFEFPADWSGPSLVPMKPSAVFSFKWNGRWPFTSLVASLRHPVRSLCSGPLQFNI